MHKIARKEIKSLWQFHMWQWILAEATSHAVHSHSAKTTPNLAHIPKKQASTRIRTTENKRAITYAWAMDTNKSDYRAEATKAAGANEKEKKQHQTPTY